MLVPASRVEIAAKKITLAYEPPGASLTGAGSSDTLPDGLLSHRLHQTQDLLLHIKMSTSSLDIGISEGFCELLQQSQGPATKTRDRSSGHGGTGSTFATPVTAKKLWSDLKGHGSLGLAKFPLGACGLYSEKPATGTTKVVFDGP